MDANKEALLKQLLGDDDLEDDATAGGFGESGVAYGVGQWPDAVLENVVDKPRNEYGYSLELQFDLVGIGGGRPFKTFLNLPDANDENEKRQTAQANNLASIMHAGEVLPKGKKFHSIDSQARYDKLVEIFRTAVGSTFPLNVTARKDKPQYTNVWGLKASQKTPF